MTFDTLLWTQAGADPGFQVRGAHLNLFWGISCEKSGFYAKKNHIFSNFRGRAPGAPPSPWIRPAKVQDLTQILVWEKDNTCIFYFPFLPEHKIFLLFTGLNNEDTIIFFGMASLQNSRPTLNKHSVNPHQIKNLLFQWKIYYLELKISEKTVLELFSTNCSKFEMVKSLYIVLRTMLACKMEFFVQWRCGYNVVKREVWKVCA